MATKSQTTILTPYQVNRYSRHIIMPQVGSVGQRKLLDAKVLMVGAGGLGSPISIYLTLAGVGTIGLVEFDNVDVTNLQRQILHFNDDIGKPKVESAVETLKSYNPDTTVNVHEEPISSLNAMEIIKDYDIIVNGADNFPTRYLSGSSRGLYLKNISVSIPRNKLTVFKISLLIKNHSANEREPFPIWPQRADIIG